MINRIKNTIIYKIGWMLLLLPLVAGCNDTDDVAAIFTGKTWKLTYITERDKHTMFPFWGNNEIQERQSLDELDKSGSYNVTFTITLTEGDLVKGKIEGTLINGGSLSGTWSANGKNNNFQATVTGNTGSDLLAKNFLEGLNSATSYTGDSKNLFIIYKSKLNEQKMQIAFHVLNNK